MSASSRPPTVRDDGSTLAALLLDDAPAGTDRSSDSTRHGAGAGTGAGASGGAGVGVGALHDRLAFTYHIVVITSTVDI